MGNLKKETFKDIWLGKRFRRFRKKCCSPPAFPMCHYCGSDFSQNVFLTGLLKKRKVFLRYIHKYMYYIVGRIARP